ncbi:MAG: hypothetical protein JW940_08815 [Polyangiaceae bacterium]|nr:hypothetical protein [Polyangiaceae bacterium]
MVSHRGWYWGVPLLGAGLILSRGGGQTGESPGRNTDADPQHGSTTGDATATVPVHACRPQ